MKNDKKSLIIATIIVFIFMIIVLPILFEEKKRETKRNVAPNIKQGVVGGKEIRHEKERRDALVRVQTYRTKQWFRKGTENETSKGTTLYDIFEIYKKNNLINKNAKWLSLKDGERFVVIMKSELVNGGLNSPQWAVLSKENSVLEGDIVTLNGTAKKYTPELSIAERDLSNESKSRELEFYLRWEELMRGEDWDESKNQINLDLIAKEYGVSDEEVDRIFTQGELEKGRLIKKIDSKVGNILNDESLHALIVDQGLLN